MEEKKPYKSFGIARTVTPETPEGLLSNELQRGASELGLAIANYFPWKTLENPAVNMITYTQRIVAMTEEEFERLREIEWMYDDLNRMSDHALAEGE